MRRGGFTLVELLVVMLILSVLIGIAVVSFSGILGQAKKVKAEQMIKNIETALGEYEARYGEYPIADYPNDEGIGAVMDAIFYGPEKLLPVKEKDLVESKYLGKKVVADPWKKPYRYRSAYDEGGNIREGIHNSEKFDIWSVGPNLKDDYGEEGEENDDIGNW